MSIHPSYSLGTATARIYSPIIVNGTIDPQATAIDKNVLVTINMTNIGNLTAKGIDVQVLSPGFKVLSEKKWPDTIYPNSSVIGQYILQPLYIGTHTIYVSTTYFTNNTAIRPFELKQMVSSAKLGEAKVQSDLFLSWSTATWLQQPLVLIIVGGIVTGIVGPRITNQHENHQKKLQVAVDIIIKISKGQAEIANSIGKLEGKLYEAVEKLSIETKGGIQKQKEELESKYKQLEEQKNKSKTDEVDILLGQELRSTSDQLEKIKKVEEDLNASMNESSKKLEEWLLANREIASLVRTFYYRNQKVNLSYEVYLHSISKYKTLVGQYYNHVKDFSISEEGFPISEDFNNYDSSLRSDIQNISYKSFNNTHFLIEAIREETLKGPFQTFLTGMKNKINKYPYRNKTLDELIDEFSVMH